MSTKQLIFVLFTVIFMVTSIVRIAKRNDDSLFCDLYDFGLAIMVLLAVGVETIRMFSSIDAKNDKEYKYEAVNSEEILKFKNCYDKKGYHVCTDNSGMENIVDRYWKCSEN